MPVDHSERGWKRVIEPCPLTVRDRRGNPANANFTLVIDRPTFIEFLNDSPPQEGLTSPRLSSDAVAIGGKKTHRQSRSAKGAEMFAAWFVRLVHHVAASILANCDHDEPQAAGVLPETSVDPSSSTFVHSREKTPHLSVGAYLAGESCQNELPFATGELKNRFMTINRSGCCSPIPTFVGGAPQGTARTSGDAGPASPIKIMPIKRWPVERWPVERWPVERWPVEKTIHLGSDASSCLAMHGNDAAGLLLEADNYRSPTLARFSLERLAATAKCPLRYD